MAEEVKLDIPDYDGPYITRRIEFITNIRVESVEIYGSWNKYEGNGELEYQGQNTYAITLGMPLGTYYYRFLVDGETWETNDEIAKTVRDGDEFNVISVREAGDEESSDEEEAVEADKTGATDQTMTYDESVGGFVVGRKKRRGRQSVEIVVPESLAKEAQEQEKLGDEAAKAPVRSKRARRRQRGLRAYGQGTQNDIAVVLKQKEEEWARMVLVQQLRMQQQHNDELNRVKTLWKQEREVRVEMHKGVKREKQDLQMKVSALADEVEKLKKLDSIAKEGDAKQLQILEESIKSKNDEIQKLKDDLKQSKEEATGARKDKTEGDKALRQQYNDLDAEKKKLDHEVQRLQLQIQSLTSQNESLVKNMETIKTGNEQTREMESQRIADLQTTWKQEKEELHKYKEELKQAKAELDAKISELTKECDAKKAAEQALESEKSKTASLQEKIKGLDVTIATLSDSSKEKAEIQKALEKQRTAFEGEKKVMEDKMKSMEEMMAKQKAGFETELKRVSDQAANDLKSLSDKAGKEATERLDALRKDIAQRDDDIRKAKEAVDKLTAELKDEKAKADLGNQKIIAITADLDDSKKQREELDKLKCDFEAQLKGMTEKFNELKQNSEASDSASKDKITSLEGEIATLKEKASAATTESEEQIAKLEKQVEDAKGEALKATEERTKLAGELTTTKEQLETVTSSETSLKANVASLEETLTKEREESAKTLAERDGRIDELTTTHEATLSKKEAQIGELESSLSTTKGQLEEKLKEFQNAETTIQQLRTEVDSEKQSHEKQKKLYEDQIAGMRERESNMVKLAKALAAKFNGFRKEMAALRTEKLEEMEKMNEYFPNLQDTLSKAFALQQDLIDDLMGKYKRELTLRRKYFNIVQDLRGNIRVFCRVRPLLQFEIDKGYGECIEFPQEGMLKITDDKGTLQTYEFDQVYSPKTSQERVSEDTTEYVQSVMDGYNVSIFAYGQTGSGKTYTMNGPADNPGVNLRALKALFTLAKQRAPMFEYKIKVAMLEVYNEKINDLLRDVDDGKSKKKDKKKKEEIQYKIRHLPDGSVEVTGLNWISVGSEKDIVNLQREADKTRSAAATDMNAHSSRSHMIVIVDVDGFNVPANIQYLGKLYLVDLAGSERVKKSGATGQALKEAQNINASLTALGNVMENLQKSSKHIPYRDSTLTDLMTNSLGGNAKTVMFINVCPTAEHAFETVSSLRFAKKVARVELGQAKAKQVKSSGSSKKSKKSKS